MIRFQYQKQLIQKNVSVTSKDSSLDVAWDNVVNVNGYQVKYVGYDSKTKDIAEK